MESVPVSHSTRRGGIKCAGQVFPTGQVDGGFPPTELSTMAREGGWDLEVGNAPEVCGGGSLPGRR